MSSLRVAPSDDVIFQSLHDEIVLLNMKTQEYFGLDDVGSKMWNLLVQSGDAEIVADCLCAEYDVERETVRKDLDILIERLLEAGLLKSADPSGPGTTG